jgi:ATP-dependent RNA helicase DDX31/DBP7
MDADLEFNFAIAPNAVAKPATKSSGGKWTARVGRMQKNKRKSGVAAKPVPAVPAVSAAPPTEEVPIEAAEPVVKAVRRTVISSLFTSLPAIEPQPSTSDVTLEDLAPSNAPSSADFGSLGILPELRRSLQGAKFGLERPTVVQRIAIPKLLRGTSDTILQAQTGSGKTIAYLLPIIQDLIQLGRKADNALDRTVGTLAIVLVPTRELAQQVYQVALSLLDSAGSTAEGAKTQSKDHLWLVPGVLSGGTTRQHEKARLRKGVPLLIATVRCVSLRRYFAERSL